MPERLLPDPATILAVAPSALLIAAVAALAAGWLRHRHHVRAPYTRKTFHFIIITAAVAVQLRWGTAGTMVYGGVVAVVVLYAVWRGAGFVLYDALARPGDQPHARLFILAPLLTTALGGLLCVILFPSWAHVGFFVVAWGDAIGEPVGARWGRRRYRVPSLAGVPATRSIEGSAAVLAASMVAASIALWLGGAGVPLLFGAALIIGIAAALVEAVSTHGMDNLTIQLAASGLAAFLLR